MYMSGVQGLSDNISITRFNMRQVDEI